MTVARNLFTSALRNLRRHWLTSLLGIVSLSVGLGGAIFGLLVLRSELGFEHFIPGYERLYMAVSGVAATERPTAYLPETPSFLAGLMRRQFPEIEQVARAVLADVRLRRGALEARDKLYWVDPQFFDLFAMHAIRGDLRTALQRADGLVIPSSIAARYFPGEDPIGQTLLIDGKHAARVEAVIEDLPAHATMLQTGIFASGAASHSGLADCERHDEENLRTRAITVCGLTFFRLRAGADIALVKRGQDQLLRSFPVVFESVRGTVLSLDEVHLFEGFNPGGRDRLWEIASISLLVLLAACVVYVNLATARAARRGVEVGVRKVCGAAYGQLLAQFLSEALLIAGLAGLLAVSLLELSLPHLNSLMDLHLQFDYWRDWQALVGIVACVLTVGLLAGAYPAVVLSGFQAREVLRSTPVILGGVPIRQGLVVLQCAVLIGLVTASIIVFRQREFAVREAITLRTDEVLVIRARCLDAFIDGLRKLHGVSAVQCSQFSLLTEESFDHEFLKDGTPITVNWIDTDLAAFRFYGIPLVAGSVEGERSDFRVVINDTLRRALHFPSVDAAIGAPLELKGDDGNWVGVSFNESDPADPAPPVRIVGVVSDFTLEAALHPARPTLYWSLRHGSEAPEVTDAESADRDSFVHIRLRGADTADTLPRIDTLWKETIGPTREPDAQISRFFLHDYIESRYQHVLRQGQLLAGFSVLAVALAGLGLLGLAAATAERRTKEIGIRKALGAGRRDILLMLLGQFSRPVLWASLLAWPVTAWLLDHWLRGFALHVPLSPGVFAGASLLALVVSLATVSAHAWRVASADPVRALRYE